jgi:hypothetical protein
MLHSPLPGLSTTELLSRGPWLAALPFLVGLLAWAPLSGAPTAGCQGALG